MKDWTTQAEEWFWDYRFRKVVLKYLRLDDYVGYLKSKRWSRIRNRVLKRDEWHCRFCDIPSKQVHHIGYTFRSMLGNDVKAVVTCCKGCHYKLEHNDAGQKLELDEVIERSHEKLIRVPTGLKVEPTKFDILLFNDSMNGERIKNKRAKMKKKKPKIPKHKLVPVWDPRLKKMVLE